MKIILSAICFLLIMQMKLFAADTARVYFRHDDKNIAENLQKLDSVSNIKSIAAIKIIGYTDHLGTNAYNLALSQKRANNVKKYLSHKLPEIQITSEGKGELQSGKSNLEGEPKNRRADIVIYFYVQNSVIEQPEKSNKNEEKDLSKIAEMEVGENLVLRSFHFIGGRHFLLPQYMDQLDTLANALKRNPAIKIEIQGFVCCTYEYDGLDYDTGEKNLSVNRAKYIYDELIKRGISRERLRYRGFGSTRPKVPYPEITEEDKTTNRRVEIRILSK